MMTSGSLAHEGVPPHGHAAGRDIVAADDEVGAVGRAAVHEDMDAGVSGVPMVDCDPADPGAKVTSGLIIHELAGEAAQAHQLAGIIGRDDGPEMMPVTLTTLGERTAIRVISVRSL